MSNNNTFSFGTPSSSGATAGGLFGSSSSFGANANQGGSNANTGSSLFGKVGSSSSGTASPSLFGAPGTSNANSASKPPMFGSLNTGAGSGSNTPTFNFGSQNQASSAAPSSTPLFGTAQTPDKTAEASAPSQTTTSGGLTGKTESNLGGLFGGITATPAQSTGGPSLFSTTPANPPPTGNSTGQMPSLLGGQNNQKPAFGSLTSKSTSTTPGATSQPQSTGGLFRSAGAAKPMFSATPSGLSTGSPFGAVNTDKPAESAASAPGSSGGGAKPLFGAAPAPASTEATPASQASPAFKLPSAGSGTQSTSLFGTPQTAESSQPSTSAPSTATPQKPVFPGLGGAASSTTPSSTPAASGVSAFQIGAPAATTTGNAQTASTSTTAAPASAGAPSMFSLGQPPASNTAATTSTTAATGTTATPATAQAMTTTDAAKPTAQTGGTGAPNLGASMAGPAPPAQSRLKNKTMDEIITRWATDLTKYQKEFREQAEKVAEWDRMLVENGTKVQKLYGNTVDAERATQEVERQLASVEGQQEELNSWLDRYEREVDEMLSKQVGPGDSLQGPDQERERTYKLAEKLSERLDEMNKDLTSMIEEVNNASSTLSKTNKTDEPISQIVRILNSHLSQLQMIDQGTTELQSKVSAAQKSGQSLGSRLGGYGYNGGGSNDGVGGSAVDDFYRSYMGRR